MLAISKIKKLREINKVTETNNIKKETLTQKKLNFLIRSSLLFQTHTGIGLHISYYQRIQVYAHFCRLELPYRSPQKSKSSRKLFS